MLQALLQRRTQELQTLVSAGTSSPLKVGLRMVTSAI